MKTTWLYSNDNEWGTFIKQGDVWEQSIHSLHGSFIDKHTYLGSLPYPFFVELVLDGTPNYIVRLYTNCAMRSDNDGEWAILHKGCWVESQATGGLSLVDEDGDSTSINLPPEYITPLPPPADATDEEVDAGNNQNKENIDAALAQADKESLDSRANQAASQILAQQQHPPTVDTTLLIQQIQNEQQQRLQREKADAEKLTQIATSLTGPNNPYEPDAGGTRCNYYLRDYAKTLYGYDFPEFYNSTAGVPFSANVIHDNLMSASTANSAHPSGQGWHFIQTALQPADVPDSNAFNTDPKYFTSIILQKAQQLANQGQFVVIAWKNPDSPHGHVAVVVPAPQMIPSGKWDSPAHPMNVPSITQAGLTVNASTSMANGFARSNTALPAFADAGQSAFELYVYTPPHSDTLVHSIS